MPLAVPPPPGDSPSDSTRPFSGYDLYLSFSLECLRWIVQAANSFADPAAL